MELPGVLEAELEVLLPDQQNPERGRQEQLMCTYESISDNVGCHGYLEMLLEELEDGDENEFQSSGRGFRETSATLLD